MFLSSADFFFQNQVFSKNYFRNTIRVSNSLEKLSADESKIFYRDGNSGVSSGYPGNLCVW